MRDPQIFLISSGALVRFGGKIALPVREEAKIGGVVPPGGPLTRRLSVMLPAFFGPRQKLCVEFPYLCLDLLAAGLLITLH